MDEFLSVIPKFLGSDILEKEESKGRGAAAARHADNEKSLAKMEFKTALFRYIQSVPNSLPGVCAHASCWGY